MKQEYYLCLMSTKHKLINLKQHSFRLYYTNYIYPGQNNSEFHFLYQGFSTSVLLTFGLINSLRAFTVHCRILAASLSSRYQYHPSACEPKISPHIARCPLKSSVTLDENIYKYIYVVHQPTLIPLLKTDVNRLGKNQNGRGPHTHFRRGMFLRCCSFNGLV